MHIFIKNRNVRMNGRLTTGGRLLNMQVDKVKHDIKTQFVKGGELLSSECAGVIGGFTNNQRVLTRGDVAALNIRRGSGFSSIPIMKSIKKSRNNLKFNF